MACSENRMLIIYVNCILKILIDFERHFGSKIHNVWQVIDLE